MSEEWAEGYAAGFDDGWAAEREAEAGRPVACREAAARLRAEAVRGVRGRSLGQHLAAAGIVPGPAGWRECLLALADAIEGGAGRG